MELAQIEQTESKRVATADEEAILTPATDSTTNDVTSALPPSTPRVALVDGCRVVGLSEEDEAFYSTFTAAQRRRVRLKTDLRLLPVLCILYLFAQLDRTNIANAKIEGFKEDTRLTDKQYNLVLALFFVPYCLLGKKQPPPPHSRIEIERGELTSPQRSRATCCSRTCSGHRSTSRSSWSHGALS